MKEPVLALGATSLVGRFLLPLAAERGLPLIAASRKPQLAGSAASWVGVDLTSPTRAVDLPPAATVLSLSPIWLLPDALQALRSRGMTRLVAFSSTSRFTKTTSVDAGERAVAERLARAEAAVEAFCAAEGVAWTVLRPTMIYAEGQDANVSRLAALIRRLGVLPLSGAGEGLRQPVHAADLAAATLRVAETPATEGRAYDLPGGETLTYREMAVRIFEGLGRSPRILSVPPSLWSVALKLASPVLPGATAAMGDRMSKDLTFDDGPAKRDFHWSPRSFNPRFTAPAIASG